MAPDAWRFSVGAHGRPAIEGPAGAPALHFNLSHTRGLVACAVGREPLLGVDVEAIDRTAASTRIAERFFAPSEVDALRRLPPEEQRERFFRFWTLKESYIKATGLGLSVPLDQFWFALTPSEPVAIEFGARITDDGSRWRFAERQPTPRHRLAVAVGADREGDWTIDLVEEALDPLVFRRLGRGA